MTAQYKDKIEGAEKARSEYAAEAAIILPWKSLSIKRNR